MNNLDHMSFSELYDMYLYVQEKLETFNDLADANMPHVSNPDPNLELYKATRVSIKKWTEFQDVLVTKLDGFVEVNFT